MNEECDQWTLLVSRLSFYCHHKGHADPSELEIMKKSYLTVISKTIYFDRLELVLCLAEAQAQVRICEKKLASELCSKLNGPRRRRPATCESFFELYELNIISQFEKYNMWVLFIFFCFLNCVAPISIHNTNCALNCTRIFRKLSFWALNFYIYNNNCWKSDSWMLIALLKIK